MPAGTLTETTVTVPAAAPAPAAAPSKPASASPTVPSAAPATTSEHSGDGGGDMESAFTKLEKRYSDKPTQADKKPDDKKGEPAKPAAKPDAAKPAATEKEDREFQPGPKQLREAKAKAESERDDLAKSIGELRAKISEYEAKGKDTTALTEQLGREKAEKESLMGELRMLKKQASPEFVEKWDKPFQKKVGHAMTALKTLTVIGETDPETGERKTPDRPAVWNDFQALYQMPLNRAIGASRKMFSPEDSSIIEDHLKDLKRLDLERSEAMEEEKLKWKENESRELAEQAQKKERYEKMMTKAREALLAEKPDIYDADPNDPEGNELLELGRKYMEEIPKTEDQMHRQYARNFLNAIAAPRLMHRLEKAQAKIAELEAQIAETKDSGPGTTRRATQGAPVQNQKSLLEEVQEAVQSA